MLTKEFSVIWAVVAIFRRLAASSLLYMYDWAHWHIYSQTAYVFKKKTKCLPHSETIIISRRLHNKQNVTFKDVYKVKYEVIAHLRYVYYFFIFKFCPASCVFSKAENAKYDIWNLFEMVNMLLCSKD